MMYNNIFYAARIGMHKDSGKDVFLFILSDLNLLKYNSDEPYYQLVFRESSGVDGSPKPDISNSKQDISNFLTEYYAWKDFERKEYLFLSGWRQGVDMCFPYGSRAEEERGRGKIVVLSLEDCILLS